MIIQIIDGFTRQGNLQQAERAKRRSDKLLHTIFIDDIRISHHSNTNKT